MSEQLHLRLRTEASPKDLVMGLLLSPIGLRLLGILFSIIVFGCVSDQADISGSCIGFSYSNACNFAVAVGVIAFLLCLVLLVKDIVFIIVDFTEAIKVKLAMCLGDAIIGGFWGFMWFVCFCFTADRKTSRISDTNRLNCVNAAIAFSFFSILVWVGIVVFNVVILLRIYRGTDGEIPGTKTAGGYASFPDNQQPPYEDDKSAPYNPPEY